MGTYRMWSEQRIALEPELSKVIKGLFPEAKSTFFWSGQMEGHEYLGLPLRRYLRLPLDPGEEHKSPAYSTQDLLSLLPGSLEGGQSLCLDLSVCCIGYKEPTGKWEKRIFWTTDEDYEDVLYKTVDLPEVVPEFIDAIYKLLLWVKQ